MSFKMFVYIFWKRILEAFFFSSFPLSQRLAYTYHWHHVNISSSHNLLLERFRGGKKALFVLPDTNSQAQHSGWLKEGIATDPMPQIDLLSVVPSLHPLWMLWGKESHIESGWSLHNIKTKTSNSRSKACACSTSSSITLFASYQNKNRRFRHYAED